MRANAETTNKKLDTTATAPFKYISNSWSLKNLRSCVTIKKDYSTFYTTDSDSPFG